MLGKGEILFKGAKPFSSTGNTIGVTLVLHSTLDIIEVISYEPNFDKEAPRLYLKTSAVQAVLDQEEIGRKLEEARESPLDSQVRDKTELLKDAVKSSTVEYILDRLCIAEFDAEKRSVLMDINSAQPGGSTGANSIACAKPKKLRMFKSPHYHTLLDGLADQMLEPARDYRTPGLRMLRRTDYIWSNQERWRIPLIFVKVQNGRILTPADARVWCAVTRAIDPEVVALAVAKALNVKLVDRKEEVEPVKSFANKSGMSLGTNLSAINTNLTAMYTAFNSKDSRTPSTAAATPKTPKSRHHPGRSSFSDTSGVSGISSPNISPTKRAQLNRAPTGMPRSPFARINTAASSSSLLAGITASMKKRFSMGLTNTDDEEGEPNKDTTSPTPQKLRRKSTAATLKKTKTARGDVGASAADKAEETKDEPEPENGFESSSISQRISAGFSAFSTSIKRTLSFKPKQAAAAAAAMQLHEGGEDSDEDVGFEKEDAMDAAKNNESTVGNTVPTRKLSMQNPSPKSVAAVPSERKKVNYAVTNDSNKPSALSSKPSLSPKTKKATSPAPKVHSRIASVRSGAMLDTARSTTSDADVLQSGSGSGPVTPVSAPAQSAEEFRDAMMKKQSTKTASAIRTMNSRASFRANTYGLEDTDPATSSSPLAQFFSKMTPTWTGVSSRVLPVESAEVEADLN